MLTLDHAGTNAWYEARRAKGDLAGHVDDLETAARVAAAAGDVSRRIAYMTMLASVRAYSGTLPPMLQRALVEAGVWTAADVLASVRAQVSPEARARASVLVGDRLGDDAERARLAAQAVEEARLVGDPVRTARVCCELAVGADEEIRGPLIELAAAAAERIPAAQDRYAALTTLADRQLDAPPAVVEAAVAGVLALLAGVRDEGSQARSLAAFVPRAAPAAWPLIARRAASLDRAEDRAPVLEQLLAVQPSDAAVALAERCLGQLDDPDARLRLAARLPDGGRRLRDTWDGVAPASLGAVLEALDGAEGELRAEMLAWCLAAADAVSDGPARLELYAVIAGKGGDVGDRIADELLYLQPRDAGVAPLSDATQRFAAVVRLAAVDPEEHAAWAGLALGWCHELWADGLGMGAVALPHVAAAVRGDDVGRALDLALTSPNELVVAGALTALAPLLSPEQHVTAIAAARGLKDATTRDGALAALAVAKPDLDTVAAIAGHATRREVVNEIAGRAAPGSLRAWIALGAASGEPERTARIQLALLDRCGEPVRAAEIPRLLATGRAAATIAGDTAAMARAAEFGGGEWSEADAVGRAAAAIEAQSWWLDALTAPDPTRLAVAAEIAAGVDDPTRRARIAVLAGDADLLGEAVADARRGGAAALARVAGALPPGPAAGEVAREAFEALPDDADGAAVAEVIAACAVHVTPATLEHGLELAQAVEDKGVRARLLTVLAPDAVAGEIGLVAGWLERLEQHGSLVPGEIERTRQELLAVLAAATAVADGVDDALLSRLVAEANANDDSTAVARALDGLAARCPGETRAAVALALAAGLDNPIVRLRAIGFIQPAPSDPGRLAAALDALAVRRRRDLLGDLACLGPLIAPLCARERAEELVAVLGAIDRWWP